MMQSDTLADGSVKATFIDDVHPVIRVILFLIFSGFVSLAGTSQLVTGALLLAVLYGLTNLTYLQPALKMMRRMRWFFLSIFIIYSWLTPGNAVAVSITSYYAGWLPTTEGIILGTMRALSLAFILLGVNLLLRCTSREQLIQAIYWLVAPLHFFGISRERLSVRIALALEVLYDVQKVVGDSFAEVKGTVRSLDDIGNFAATVFRKVIHHAENTSVRTITLYDHKAPRSIQWLMPVVLCLIFIGAGMF